MRPRERLIDFGPTCLSDSELLTLVLQTGNQRQSAAQLAHLLMQDLGSLSAVVNAPLEQFISVPGLGPAKYAAIQAGAELSKRSVGRRQQGEEIRHPLDLSDNIRSRLGGLPHEAFGAAFIDSRSRLIRVEVLFRGTLTQTSVYPRELVSRSLQLNATRLVVFHNHPSGLAEPSLSDLRLTQSLRALLDQIDIDLWAHLLLAGEQVVSLGATD